MVCVYFVFFFSSRRRHTRCALVTGVQTCALPIYLARPALYDAWHDFAAVKPSGETMTASIVGPVCETGDTFARDRLIDKVESGDLAIFRSAGAYGATMASTRSEEHKSELQSLMRISYAVLCWKKKKNNKQES